MEVRGIRLRNAMLMASGNPWTIGTEDGNGWLFYHDGKELHTGTRRTLEELLDRECVEIYERPERKRFFRGDTFKELEKGLAFVVTGRENGDI